MHPVANVKKVIEVHVQWSEFYSIDLYQRGLYQLKCRLYTGVTRDGGPPRRVDGIPRLVERTEKLHSSPDTEETFLATESDSNYEHFPPRVDHRSQCPKEHKACNWTCRPAVQPLTEAATVYASADPNVYTTRTFLISREAERVPLQDLGVVFRLEVDVMADEVRDYCSNVGIHLLSKHQLWDGFLEVELWFTDDESAQDHSALKLQQQRKYRLRHLLHPDIPSSYPRIQQYIGVNFDGIFFSSCGLVISAGSLGYTFDLSQKPVPRPPSQLGGDSGIGCGSVNWLYAFTGLCVDSGSEMETASTATRPYLVDLINNAAGEAKPLDFDDPAEREPTKMQKLLLELMHHSIVAVLSLHQLLASAVSAEGEVGSPDGLITGDALLKVVRDATGIGDKDMDMAGIIKKRGLEDSAGIQTDCFAILDEWHRVGRSDQQTFNTLVAVIAGYAQMLQSIWQRFLDKKAFLSPLLIQKQMAIWARLTYSNYCRHIVPHEDGRYLDDQHALIRRTQDRLADSLFQSTFIEEEDRPIIPIILEHSRKSIEPSSPLPSETPTTPIRIVRSLNRPNDSPPHHSVINFSIPQAESSSRSLLRHKSIADEDASVLGIAAPKSIASLDRASIVSMSADNVYMHEIELALSSSLHVHGPQSGAVSPGLGSGEGRGCHLWVFVHGLLGSAFDFRQYKNRIIHALYDFGVYRPNLMFLISQVNEEDTFGDIDKLAEGLVNEITNFIDTNAVIVDKLRYGRCSDFVGVYQTVSHSKCLEQLTLKDGKELPDSLLYRLATNQRSSMKSFRVVRLLASQQDNYAPYHSALSQEEPKAVPTTPHGKAYTDMVAGFLDSCGEKCERFSVWFPGLEKSTDLLGRKAHVAMLEDKMFLELALVLNRLHLST
ncbi:hypothetical protein HDV00_002475 [Rhizophlyctis rosea]|nr:hypothetical protein HDV00_002475 [Rhizophlyctis rosea]